MSLPRWRISRWHISSTASTSKPSHFSSVRCRLWTATQGPTSPLVAQALDNLGSLYAAQKRYDEAEPFFRKGLTIRETRDIESLSNLALLYEAQKDWKRADDYFQRAILLGEKGLGGDHQEIVETLDEYAVMLHAAGRLADARKMEAHAK